MSSDNSDDGEVCNSHAALFYGLHVYSESLVRPIEAFNTLNRQLAILNILATRRRSGSRVFDCASAASRIPEEIWEEIRSSLISQELDRLEEIENIGNADYCGGGARLKKKAEKEWDCDQRKELPGCTAALCASCRRHTLYGFEVRENALEILEALLATYRLFKADISFDPHGKHFGIAVHPPLKACSDHYLGASAFAFNIIPISISKIDTARSGSQMSAFLYDFRVDVPKDPLYSVEEDPERNWPSVSSDDDDHDVWLVKYKKGLEKELKERQRKHPSMLPRLMLMHNTQTL